MGSDRILHPSNLDPAAPAGGLVSGFFGGLSGNHGALRSAFLIKAGLSKEAFVATGVVIAVLVDAVRLLVYGASFAVSGFSALGGAVGGAVVVATLAAFAGAYLGVRLIGKVTLRAVQLVVAQGMALIGFGLAVGVI